MRERQIRRMPVLDAEGKPVGVVTLGDLAKRVQRAPRRSHEELREISEPHRRKTRDEPAEAERTQPDARDRRGRQKQQSPTRANVIRSRPP